MKTELISNNFIVRSHPDIRDIMTTVALGSAKVYIRNV